MRLLVTGASGLLGFRVVEKALERGWEVVGVYNRHEIPLSHRNLRKVKLDISKSIFLEDLILKTRPDVIVHSAAYTDVDGCEVNREYAWRVNVEATRSVVLATRVVRAYLVYVSTDYVFDGEKGMYKEEDMPYPVNYYGLTKLVAEQLVKNRDLLYCVVRPSAIYGWGPGKRNFATFVVEKLARGERVKALVDQFVSPTLNSLLADAILEIAEIKPLGFLHIAGERMSRFDFAVRIAEKLGLPVEGVEEAHMDELNWKARRPVDSSLDVSRASRLLKVDFSGMDRALDIFAEEYRSLGGERASGH